MQGLIYINHGRIIVDCPFGCRNAYRYVNGQTQMVCSAPDGCQVVFSLAVPDNLNELFVELMRRPNRENRNWFPDGHPLAVAANCAMGQSVADLAQEFEMERTMISPMTWSSGEDE